MTHRHVVTGKKMRWRKKDLLIAVDELGRNTVYLGDENKELRQKVKDLEAQIVEMEKAYQDLDDKYYKLQKKEKIKAQNATREWLYGEHE